MTETCDSISPFHRETKVHKQKCESFIIAKALTCTHLRKVQNGQNKQEPTVAKGRGLYCARDFQGRMPIDRTLVKYPWQMTAFPLTLSSAKGIKDSRVRSTLRITPMNNNCCLEVLHGVRILFYRQTEK